MYNFSQIFGGRLADSTAEIGKVRVTAKNCDTGLTEQINACDNSLHTIDYLDQIATGKIANHNPFRGYGQRINCSTIATGDDIWEGTATTIPIPNQTTGEQMTVVSTSANDTLAGTGVQKVDIHYLDHLGVERTEILSMNGVTPVNTVATNIRFINSLHSEQVDGNGTAVGTITIYKTGAATTIYNQISIGGNQSLNTARMVPAGKTFYLKSLSVSAASNKSVSIKLRATSTFESQLTNGLFFLFKDVMFLQNSTRVNPYSIAWEIPALAIIKLTAYSVQAGADVAASWEGWVET